MRLKSVACCHYCGRLGFVATIVALGLMSACDLSTVFQPTELNPYRDLPAVSIDGRSRRLEFTITPIGSLSAGRVVRVRVDEGANAAGAVESVLLLTDDALMEASGVIVGGGRANTDLDFRIAEAGRYFVFVQTAADADVADLDINLTLEDGPQSFASPASQTVMIRFEEDFLTNPGLLPDDFSTDQQAFLVDVSEQVRSLIVDRLRAIFDGTPIRIVDERDGQPDGDFSTLTFSPDRVPANLSDFTGEAAVTSDLEMTACNRLVIFGEVLPAGADLDRGNRNPSDDAVVYVGSFQGRTQECLSAAINSINNIVLGLSQTGAHEIGHLVGLYHVTLLDIMLRSPNLSFQRELPLTRGQIVLESVIEQNGVPVAARRELTNVVQDPERYFRFIFSTP